VARDPLRAVLSRERVVVAVSLAGLWVVALLFLAHLAAKMDSMEGVAARMMGMPTPGGLSAIFAAALSPGAAAFADAAVNFALVALMWAVMMVGMMLPGAAPTVLLFAALERRRAGGGGRVASFVAGYLAIWTLFSIAAAAAQTALARAGLVSMQMAASSALLAAGFLLAAGAWQLTPLKDRCLVHCRSPLEWIPRHMRPGRAGAFRMGAEHGTYCVGCCWALMLLLFVGGVMNLVWVAALGGFVLVEKIAPRGRRTARLAGAALVLGGAVLLARPLFA
jgi:predicted metal-binding membrane protein